MVMGESENRAAIEQLKQLFRSGDFQEATRQAYDLHHPTDFVAEWPQSGERIRGRDNFLAINDNYPETPTAGGRPMVEIRRMHTCEDLVVVEGTIDYGGGRTTHWTSILEFRDGKVVRETDYFADPFEAPEWRSQWVERATPVA
jgi:hypothetical protein